MKRAFYGIIVSLVLTGCATMQATQERVDIKPLGRSTIYTDEWVQRTAPEVYIRPAEPAAKTPSVLFFPLRVTQEMQDARIAGYTVSRVIWQTWSSMQVFHAMEFASDDTPYRRDLALQFARARKADLAIGGFVTHLYAGGTAAESSLSVQIEAIDTVSGQVVWSMGQGGLMPASKTTDYLLFATKTRTPANPLQAIARVIAIDTGSIIQDWMVPAPAADGIAKLDQDLRDSLYRERDPIPAPRSAPSGAPGQQPAPSF